MKALYLGWLICLITAFELKGQIKISDVGFSTGWGYALNNRSIPEGVYRLAYFQGICRISVLAPSPERGIFETVYVGAEPQYNLVWIDQKQENFEAGIHFILQPTFRLSEHWKAFLVAGIGPHYFSTHTIAQAKGFIFSDSMGWGVGRLLSAKTFLFINFRIRHLSNANTRLPNLGINTYNFHIGFTRRIGNINF